MRASSLKHWARWIRVLAWIGASVAVIASSDVLPPWATIALAAGVFAAQVLLPHGAAACHLPERVTNGPSADR